MCFALARFSLFCLSDSLHLNPFLSVQISSHSRAAKNAFVLSRSLVIGATAVGAIKSIDAIGAAKPRVLIVEEAAEIPVPAIEDTENERMKEITHV